MRLYALLLAWFVVQMGATGFSNAQETEKNENADLTSDQYATQFNQLQSEHEELFRQRKFRESAEIKVRQARLVAAALEATDHYKIADVIASQEQAIYLTLGAGAFEPATDVIREFLGWRESTLQDQAPATQTARIELDLANKVLELNAEHQKQFSIAAMDFAAAHGLGQSKQFETPEQLQKIVDLMKSAIDHFEAATLPDCWYSMVARLHYQSFSRQVIESADDAEALLDLFVKQPHLLPNHPRAIAAMVLLNQVYNEINDNESAIRLAERYLEIDEQYGISRIDVNLHMLAAQVVREKGNPKKGYLIGQDALARLPESSLEKLRDTEILNIEFAYRKHSVSCLGIGDIAGAISCIERSIEHSKYVATHSQNEEKLEQARGAQALCTMRLAIFQSQLGKHDLAKQLVRESLAIQKEFFGEDSAGFAHAAENACRIYYVANDLPAVIKHAELALLGKDAVKQDGDVLSYSRFLFNISIAMNAASNWEKSQELLYESRAVIEAAGLPLGIKQHQIGKINRLLAESHLRLGDRLKCHKMAEAEFYRKLESLPDQMIVSNDAEAEVAFKRVHDSQMMMLMTMDFDDIDQINSAFQSVVLTKAICPQFLAARDRQIDQVSLDQAVRFQEQYREVLARMSAVTFDTGASRQHEKHLLELEKEKRKLFDQLPLEIKNHSMSTVDRKTLFPRMADAVPDNWALIEIVKNPYPGLFGAKPIYQFFVIRRNEERERVISTYYIDNADQVDAWVKTWRSRFVSSRGRGVERVRKSSDKEIAKAGQELLEVWKTMARFLNDETGVIISGDSVLGQLPWATLPNGKTYTRPDGTEVPGRLLDDYQFVDQISSRFLLRPERRPVENNEFQAAIFSNVDFGPVPEGEKTASTDIQRLVEGGGNDLYWPRLGEARGETTSFLKCFDGLGHRQFEQKEASKKNFLAIENARYLHFATHGYSFTPESSGASHIINLFDQDPNVYRRNPWALCGMVLSGVNENAGSGASGNPGIVSGNDIVRRSFEGTDLVVLSTCLSGKGLVPAGAGSRGTQHAFLYAGARAAIGSYWSVSDSKTDEFMKLFYENLEQGQNAGDALYNTQIAFRDQGESIQHWGAWSISGDWKVQVNR